MRWYLSILTIGCLITGSVGHAQTDIADLVLRDVRVFDSRTREVSGPVDVEIRDGKIRSITESGPEPKARQVIAGRGRLLAPGLVDTHVHLAQILRQGPDALPEELGGEASAQHRSALARRFLAFGTTSIVDMGMPEHWIEAAVDWQRSPDPDRPRLHAVGGALISDLPWNRQIPPHHVVVADPDAARRKVREYAEKGLSHVKLYWKLEVPELEAAFREAKTQGLIAAAHTDNGITTIDRALEVGVRHFEHFFTLIPSVLDDREHDAALNRDLGITGPRNIDEFAARTVLYFDYAKKHPELDAALLALIDRMGEAGASLSSAIHVVGASAGATSFFSSFEDYPERDAPRLEGYDDAQRRRLRGAFDVMMSYVRAAHERGVLLRIGTDCREGGQAVLSEMKLLCDAGIPPAEVLQIATWNGAQAMGLTKEAGVIEVGHPASLVLFEKNPLEDPAHFSGEKLVIHEGVVREEKSEKQ